jgi:hypothetical protein
MPPVVHIFGLSGVLLVVVLGWLTFLPGDWDAKGGGGGAVG